MHFDGYRRRKSALPTPAEVPERLHEAAQAAASISLGEPRLAGFPLFSTDSMEIIEPVVAFLHEHAFKSAYIRHSQGNPVYSLLDSA